MAVEWGEPEWCKGYGVRNTHRMAIAPNMSSAVMAGQVSQGIEPIIANVYTQATTAGEMQRINPEYLNLAKEIILKEREESQEEINNASLVDRVINREDSIPNFNDYQI